LRLRTNFGFDKDTSKYLFTVCFLDMKFAQRLIQPSGELHIQHTGGNTLALDAKDESLSSIEEERLSIS